MHLLATRPGGYAAGDGIVDLEQSPADVVLLSAADTELALLARAADALPEDLPSLRLASLLHLRSHASVDLYMDRVVRHARLVVVSLMGGVSYWSYGVDRLCQLARAGSRDIVLVPGEDEPDPELDALSTQDAATCHRVWRYLREGGPHNARALLEWLAHRFFGRPDVPPEPRVLPRVALYHPAQPLADLGRWREDWHPDRPVAALLFYRSHLQASNLRAFDVLIEALQAAGLDPLPIAVASLRSPVCHAAVEQLLEASGARVVVNTTGFALGSPDGREPAASPLGEGLPVLQVIASGSNLEDWREGSAGLSPRDLAMNVVLPEVDGRIITRATSFKDRLGRSERTQCDVVGYRPEPGRARFVAELAAGWARLAHTPVSERRVALVLANYPTRDGRLGNGVGLDTPASILEILRDMAAQGYDVRDLPASGAELMQRLRAQVTNDVERNAPRPCAQSLSLEAYEAFLGSVPEPLVDALHARWGAPEDDPMLRHGRLMVPGLRLGAVFVGIQPARGYHLDVRATYHDPDLIPPHGYLAFYAWVRSELDAHAVVHVGKHGNLEWLPGKGVALSELCWPDAVLGPLPHLYPFIVNDPGEGTQAKRRTQAVIVDHLVPPLTRAETYGELRRLEQAIDEYAEARALDPRRARVLRREIASLVQQVHLDRELDLPAVASDPDDEDWIVALDAYLCELKEAQIRDGLHVFGRAPEGDRRLDTLVALARCPEGSGDPAASSLLCALARALVGEGFDPLDPDWAAPWTGPRPDLLAKACDTPWRTQGDTRERLELLARAIAAGEVEAPAACDAAVERLRHTLAPALDACGAHELAGLRQGLSGRFVPPGPSGPPTRGRPDVLPTGRNFYSVDTRALPTRAAWQLATRAADQLVRRHVQDHGEYPRCIGLSVWGTATMRTGGDDIAQALALLGVRPVWDPRSGRVVDSEILPAGVLGRPRVDVVLRISGFFRDAFPDLITLVDAAVRRVAELPEPEDVNPLRARVHEDEAELRARGVDAGDASRRARWRIFGSKPGAYGAGLQGLIDERCWTERADLARAYLHWSGYAYASDQHGAAAHDTLEERLAHVEAVLHNQDNREHDLLDSDDYYQFHGGLAAAVERARGTAPALYHGDHSNPAAPRVRTLREELGRVFRGRAINPKWIAGARRHGYKGAAEMAATLDYLFAYDAATGVVDDYQYALVADAYLLDSDNRAFLREHNRDALIEMSERLLEAIQRGMWHEPGAYRDRLEALLLDEEEERA